MKGTRGIPGMVAAGLVESVGAGVERPKVGEGAYLPVRAWDDSPVGNRDRLSTVAKQLVARRVSSAKLLRGAFFRVERETAMSR